MDKKLPVTCRCDSLDGFRGMLLYFDDTISEIVYTNGFDDIEFDNNPDHRTLKVKLVGMDKQEWELHKVVLDQTHIEIQLKRKLK